MSARDTDEFGAVDYRAATDDLIRLGNRLRIERDRLRAENERLRTRLFIQVGWFVPSEDPADIRDHLVGLGHPSGLLPNAEPVYRVKEPGARLSGRSGDAS